MLGKANRFCAVLFAAALLLASSAIAQETVPTMTLEEVLRTARAANAALRVPSYDVSIAEQRRQEALAVNEWKVLFSGDLIVAPPPTPGYDPAITNEGEERAQVIAARPIIDGGARKAGIAVASAELSSARAGYRIAERDLELEVRNNYIDAQDALREIEARQGGIEQLRDYRVLLESRKASGMPVQPEILRLDLRIASEQDSILQAKARRRQALLALNDLMGRDPTAPLELAPLPPLSTPPADEMAPPSRLSRGARSATRETGAGVGEGRGTPRDTNDVTGTAANDGPTPPSASPLPSGSEDRGEGVVQSGAPSPAASYLPEIDAAFAGLHFAEAGLEQTRAERKFKLDFSADAGLWGSDPLDLVPADLGPNATFSDRLKRDIGFSLFVGFSLPLRDKTYAARLAQARLDIEQARQNITVAERNANLQQARAHAALRDVYEEIEHLRKTVDTAHDAWLESESLYLGGSVPFVDLTDAYSTWIDSQLQLANAERRYREAEALLLRWTSSP